MTKLPTWADVALVPLISLILAAAVSALVLLAIGQSPSEALKVMVEGALVSPYGWGYTLYYATSFIFTGLSVTIAYHAGLFNIGSEGQAQLGGGARLSAGQTRQPYRDHHDHVQLYRRGAADLRSSRSDAPRWPDGTALGPLSRGRQAADAA